MAYTPDALTSAMQHLDYPVRKRRLIDWVQKGLLPHPTPRGRGRGPGKIYEWHEPDILHRATDVFELLEWHRRAKDVVLPLWALGYEMSTDWVRPELQRRADSFALAIEQAVPIGGDRSDLVDDLVHETEAQFQDNPNHVPSPVVEAFLHAAMNPEAAQWSWIVDDLRAAVMTDEGGLMDWSGERRMAELLAMVREQFSVGQLQSAVAGASDVELSQVQDDLRGCVQSARAVASLYPDLDQLAFPHLIASLSVIAGIIDLAGRHAGYGAMIDRLVENFARGCRQVLTDPRFRAEIQRLRKQGGCARNE